MEPWGLSTITATTSFGSLAGTIPMNDAMYSLSEYLPSTTTLAVPVLPARSNPGIAAPDAVPPSASTPRSMSLTSDAVLVEMMRCPAGIFWALPPMDWTMCGERRMPPLAIAEYAVAIWIGVTDSPWPIGRLPIDDPEYCDTCLTMPVCSPGMSEPVVCP